MKKLQEYLRKEIVCCLLKTVQKHFDIETQDGNYEKYRFVINVTDFNKRF